MPTGETFEDKVIVAADIVAPNNPDGTFERGTMVDTTWGDGIIVDYYEEAVKARKENGEVRFDIGAAWKLEPYNTASLDGTLPVIEFEKEIETRKTPEEVLKEIIQNESGTLEAELAKELLGTET